MKILIHTKVDFQLKEVLEKKLKNDKVVFASDPEDIDKHLKDSEVLIPERFKVDKDVLDKSQKLRLIHCGTGYNNVDISETKKREIYVATTPGIVAQSVAELVFSYINEFTKKTSFLDASMKHGGWSTDAFRPYNEISGKILGLIGYGEIAKKVEKIAEGYGMHVYINRKKMENKKSIGKIKPLEDILKISDFITIHIPFNDETRNLIDNREFDLMKESSYLINTSRGGIVNENALISALQKRKIAGAALDVYSTEPLPQESDLRKTKALILTPHTAYKTEEALNRRYNAYANNIFRLKNDLTPINTVSP